MITNQSSSLIALESIEPSLLVLIVESSTLITIFIYCYFGFYHHTAHTHEKLFIISFFFLARLEDLRIIKTLNMIDDNNKR